MLLLLLLLSALLCKGSTPQRVQSSEEEKLLKGWKDRNLYYFDTLSTKIADTFDRSCRSMVTVAKEGTAELPATREEIRISSFPPQAKLVTD